MSIPSEKPILSYSSIFITHTNIHLKKLVDNTYYLLQKQILQLLLLFGALVFYSNLSSELNLVFMKAFPYSPASPAFIVLIRYLIFIQNFTVICQYFFVFVCKSKSKVFISITLFHISIYFTNNEIQWIYTMNIFMITNFFFVMYPM